LGLFALLNKALMAPFGWPDIRLKNTVGWFIMKEKYCFNWKNKLKKTDYKPDERAQSILRFPELPESLLNLLGLPPSALSSICIPICQFCRNGEDQTQLKFNISNES
jgi:hypothetical protein